MEEDPGGAIVAMKAKDQRENLSPSRGEAMEEEAQGGEPLLLSLGGAGVPPGGESSPRHSSKNPRRRWPGSASAPSGAGHGPASKCVCTPVTHAGSFKCRFHRTNSQGHGQGQGSLPSSPPSPAVANAVPRDPSSPSSSSGTVVTQ
uniref:Uncharacterized protein n=1 Tax=Aegilops tauschii TaxID=37682 RepID=M8C1K1_AEGTA